MGFSKGLEYMVLTFKCSIEVLRLDWFMVNLWSYYDKNDTKSVLILEIKDNDPNIHNLIIWLKCFYKCILGYGSKFQLVC